MSLSVVAHHCILSPVGQAVVHCDLLPFGDVTDRYDDQPYLRPTVDLSDAAVGWRMEEHGPPNPTRPFFSQLWHTEKYNLMLVIWILYEKTQTKKRHSGSQRPRLVRGGRLTRAERDRAGSRGCQVEGGGPLPPLGTGPHLRVRRLFLSITS